jgi:gamma-glutamyl hercynylcysteine S-oxide synthase
MTSSVSTHNSSPRLPNSSANAAYSPLVRSGDRDVLSLALMDTRNYTLALLNCFEPLAASNYLVPYSPTLNLPLWELAHLAWFQERWCVRYDAALGRVTQPSIFPDADALFDSTTVAHTTRWQQQLPPLAQVRQYLADSLDLVLDKLSSTENTASALYFYRLCVLHEDMHAEAFSYTAQALALKSAGVLRTPSAPPQARAPLHVPAQRYRIGADAAAASFCFDNEKWAHEQAVPEFEIDAQPVTWAQYLEFISDGGYDELAFWSAAGQQWLADSARRCPLYVEQAGAGAIVQRYGTHTRVSANESVRHVSLWEAQAYSRWTGRRLPTELEWELAAVSGARRGFTWGQVHEWTATPFRPYPGFAPDPYKEYSEPWFNSHQSVRGASFATSPRLCYPQYRNFYEPQRDDVFIGFRTCGL